MLSVDHINCIDKLFDYFPDVVEKVNNMLNKQMQNKKEEKEQSIKRIDRKEKENLERLERQSKKEVEEKNIRMPEENVSTPVVKPRKSKIYKQPIENYEFEYDETDGEDEYLDDENE